MLVPSSLLISSQCFVPTSSTSAVPVPLTVCSKLLSFLCCRAAKSVSGARRVSNGAHGGICTAISRAMASSDSDRRIRSPGEVFNWIVEF